MLYKNSLKLIFSNFSLVWKILLYVLAVSAFCFGMCYLVAIPVINLLRAEGFFDLIKSAYEEFIASYSFVGLSGNIANIFEKFVSVISTGFSNIWLSVLLFCFILIIMMSFLNGFCLMPVCGTLYHSMGSNTSTSLVENFMVNFKKNLKYSILNVFIGLPVDVLICYFVVKIMVWVNKFASGVLFLAPTLALLVFVVLFALKTTLTSAWVPSQIVKDINPINGLVSSFKISKIRFVRDFSNAVGLLLSVVFINMFSLVCTFGIGLIISIPISYLWYATFNMTSYYTSSGMRFYVDAYNIISPKKRELSENVSSLKYFL